jgi:hypothetical protein
MKRKFFLLSVVLFNYGLKAFCQENPQELTEGYIEHAVPPFDNRTRQLDMSKLEIKPIILYKPSQQNPPQQFRNGNNNITVADNTDVQVFPSTNPQSEQHMTVSKINPDNIILSSNTPFYQGYYVSQNGGSTWFGSDNMPDGVGTSGDPTTAVNNDGSLFLETIDGAGYKLFKSIDEGNTWPGPLNYTYSPASFDKEMMTIDNLPGSPYLNNVYTAWTDFTGSYSVRFNRIIRPFGYDSLTPNITLRNNWGQGANVETGPSGEVYVCWANYGTGTYPADGIGFSRSLNGGSSFTDLTPAFAFTGIRVGGSDPIFNNTRVADFPSMAVDKSCNFTRGRVYIAYPGKQDGTGKAVIYVRSSDNQGTSWSAASEVSIVDGRQNWFPWITVDDATSTVSVAYLTFDSPSGFSTNTYLAYSFTGGASWSNIKVSDVSHTVAAIPGFATGYCGDYIANSGWANKNYIAWNDDRTGQWQNYVSRVDFSQQAIFSSNTDFNISGPQTYSLPTASNVLVQAGANINSPVGTALVVDPGTSVTFLASGHVILNPGFIANSGCHFDALIGSFSPCINTIQMDEVSRDAEHINDELKPAYKGDATVQFSVYPNPAGNEINFEYLLPDNSEVSLTLMDLEGKEVKVLINKLSQGPGLNHYNADISSLTGGIYAYKLVTKDYVKMGKFVKTE